MFKNVSSALYKSVWSRINFVPIKKRKWNFYAEKPWRKALDVSSTHERSVQQMASSFKMNFK